MHQRAFVLLPLAELAPELVAEIPAGQRVEKLAP
jgi:7,8-dihydro-6-hydroxymethylpterin-pyrophosphokinase